MHQNTSRSLALLCLGLLLVVACKPRKKTTTTDTHNARKRNSSIDTYGGEQGKEQERDGENSDDHENDGGAHGRRNSATQTDTLTKTDTLTEDQISQLKKLVEERANSKLWKKVYKKWMENKKIPKDGVKDHLTTINQLVATLKVENNLSSSAVAIRIAVDALINKLENLGDEREIYISPSWLHSDERLRKKSVNSLLAYLKAIQGKLS